MGGGVLRTAAKAAVLGGYRSAATAATRPAATSVAAASEVVPAAVSITGVGPSAAASAVVQRAASWEVDDWEFAGGKYEEELFDSMNPPTRLVFGPPPTIEEAKEATADLKEALELAYFPSPSVDESQMSVQTTRALAAEHNDKACATNFDSAVAHLAPTHVMQAFSLLQGSTEAQEVVASLAADKNVWDAVMKNEKVMQFYMNHRSAVSPDERISEYGENTTMHENEDTEAPLEDSDATPVNSLKNSENRVSEFMTKIKTKVSKMVSNLTEFFQDIFGTSPAASSSTNTKTASTDNVGMVFGSSFIALAVAAILVVLLKRE